MTLNGVEIVSSPYATSSALKVERMAIPKRRRRWRLAWRTQPAAYMAGGVLVMHPDLIAKLPKAPQP